MATVTKAGLVVHEETCGGLTACGRQIGSEREGWLHEGRDVTCKLCRRVLDEARAYKDFYIGALGDGR